MTSDTNAAPTTQTFDQSSARSFCGDLASTVDMLIDVLNEETKLIRAARLTDAAAMSDRKSDVSQRYLKAHGVLKASGPDLSRLAPDEVGHLRERHHALESAISLNLAVLATARTVSETLIRGVADTVANRTTQPQTYGADARHASQTPRTSALSYNGAI